MVCSLARFLIAYSLVRFSIEPCLARTFIHVVLLVSFRLLFLARFSVSTSIARFLFASS